MTSLLAPLAFGFVLGIRHAFDPDHLAAVAALLGRGDAPPRGSAARIGAMWGAGHAVSLLLAGTAVILIGRRIPPGVQILLDAAVAIALIAIGGGVLIRVLRGDRPHIHVHDHGGLRHAHLHFHPRGGEDGSHRHHPIAGLCPPGRRPFLLGMLHGLSGTGAATMLVLAAAPGTLAAIGSLALFGAGALAGMAALASILGLPLELAERRSSAFHSALRFSSALASLFLGAALGVRALSSL